jgi:hypothetical protein
VDFRLKDQNPSLDELPASSPDIEDPWKGYWNWCDHEEIRPDSIGSSPTSWSPGCTPTRIWRAR